MGDHDDMKKAIAMLDEVKESIINAYEIKTGLTRDKLSRLMDAETWMNANKAVELGFADGVLEDEKTVAEIPAYAFSRKTVQATLMNKIVSKTALSRKDCMNHSGDECDGLAAVDAKKSVHGQWGEVVVKNATTEDVSVNMADKGKGAGNGSNVKPAGRSVAELKARLETIKDFI